MGKPGISLFIISLYLIINMYFFFNGIGRIIQILT
ncbi:unnamed protein product [Brassica oleracea var. botrytis]